MSYEQEKRELRNKAADLIEKTGWCQGHCAVDSAGRMVSVESNHATAFCLYGALLRASGYDHPTRNGPRRGLFEDILRDIHDEMRSRDQPGTPIGLNDEPSTTKEVVIAALRCEPRPQDDCLGELLVSIDPEWADD